MALVRSRVIQSRGAHLVVVTGAAVLLFRACLGASPLQTHEGLETYFRAHEFLKELRWGHFAPQVFPGAVRGAGAAFPHYYPPVAYYVAAALSALTDVARGVNLAFLLSVVLSGWAMYWLVTRVTENRLAALAASLLYLALPYRFVDVFVRGALAESWAYVWYPLVLGGIWSTVRRRSLAWHLPLTAAALVLTHHAMALFFYAVVGLLVVLAWWREGWRPAAAVVGGLALAAGLTLWFVLPQQRSIDRVRVGDPVAMGADATANQSERVLPHELAGSWENGFRGYSKAVRLKDGGRCPVYFCGLNFALGPGQLVVAVMAGGWLAVVLASRRWPPGRPWLVAGLSAGWALSVGYMLAPRAFLALLPEAFGYVQFPWRLLGLTAFFAAAVLGLLVVAPPFPRWAPPAAVACTAVLALAVPPAQQAAARYRGTTAGDIARLIPTSGDRGFTAQGEYLPNEVDPNDVARSLVPRPEVRGDGRLVHWRRHRGRLDATIEARSPVTVVLPLLFYDFYDVRADGRAVRTFGRAGLLAARVPAGTTSVRVTEGLSTASHQGIAATLVTGLVLMAVLVRRRGKGPRLHSEAGHGRGGTEEGRSRPAGSRAVGSVP